VSQGDPEALYLSSLRSRLQGLLGRDLVGVYVGGSFALGDYRRQASDLDLTAVVSAPLSDELRQQVVERLRHESLRCPARGLELVIYRRETASSGSITADFELNLNTGSQLPLRIDSRAAPGEGHWFPIDRSMLSQAGIPLFGPPAGEIFSWISPQALAPILVESLRWHRAHLDRPSDAVLNACRSLRFTIEGRWSSKPTGGRWAVDAGLAPRELVDRACAGRLGTDPAQVVDFLAEVESRLTGRQSGFPS
jgi:aminoglycoside adenylyltransferase-like protein/nucleotidyltransferase-like protein